MSDKPADQLPDWLRSAGELGVGSVILAVRRLNIVRAEVSEQWPAAGAAIDQAFERAEDLVEEVGEPVGEQLDNLLRAVEGFAPDSIADAAALGREGLAKLPMLARIAGLTSTPNGSS